MQTDPSGWSVLLVTADVPVREIISAHLSEYCLGVIDEETTSRYYFDPDLQLSVEKALGELDRRHPFTCEWTLQKREDWHLEWQGGFKSVFINDRLAVVPEWDSHTLAEHIIRIIPGNAFGTGRHETTSMALQHLWDILKPGMSVLDVGTGSGILAIGAKLLGAGVVTCLEMDASCETNFYENVHLNGLDGQLMFVAADVLEWTSFAYHLLLVNVNRNVILSLIPLLKETTGDIVLTGILKSDIPMVSHRCLENQFLVSSRSSLGDWTCLRIQKNKDLS